jgi:hypothetical protein
MTQTLPDASAATATPTTTSVEKRPGRLILRRRLLLWSVPALLLLAVLAVKLASVGILGDRLAGQFAAHDPAAMNSTLGWLDVGSFGRGYKAQFAAGDMLMLKDDKTGALEQFRQALDKAGSGAGACPPRANFALTSELLSDAEVKAGHFFKARKLLEPAVPAAEADKPCFATSKSPSPDIRTFISQTPDRLKNKLAALKGGRITQTPDGYDYIRAPGGMIEWKEVAGEGPCPYANDDVRMRECIQQQDAGRAERTDAAKKAHESAQPQPPAPPPAAPAPPPAGAPPPPGSPGAQGPPQQSLEYPGPPELAPPDAFCTPNGDPLHDLGTVLCDTAGPSLS